MNAITEAQYLQPQFGLTAIAPDFQQLTLEYDLETRSAWTGLKPHGRACFTLGLLSELGKRDKHFRANRHQGWVEGQVFPIEYQVVASAHPGVFSFGGDLALFVMLIKARDRAALLEYARACIEPAWQRLTHYDGSATTISLVEGDALGGGFECALTSDIIIAEEQVRMGFPEILFNLFPGMGAYSVLSRKVGQQLAEKMMLSGELYGAEELKDMGIVDMVVARGEGRKATFHYMVDNRKRANGMHGVLRCREFTNPISKDELMNICGVWADAALRLTDRDMRMMQRLVRAQLRQQYEDGHEDLQAGLAASTAAPAQVFDPVAKQVEVEFG
jgi:DSF synthase